MVRNTELWGFFFFLAFACGEAKKSGGDGESGGESPGGTSGGGTSSGGSAGSGAASGTAPGGTASGGTTSGGTTSGTTSGGTMSGGTSSAGASGSGAASGSAGAGGWSAACGDVTHNGRCVGNVYQWCDYFEEGLREMDCGARGMTCRAVESQTTEEDSNGCYLEGACDEADQGCEGQIALRCRSAGLQAMNCKKNKGPTSQCLESTAEIPYPRCDRSTPCSGRSSSECDGNMLVICDEDGFVYLQNCAQRTPTGRCVDNASYPDCDPPFLGG